MLLLVVIFEKWWYWWSNFKTYAWRLWTGYVLHGTATRTAVANSLRGHQWFVFNFVDIQNPGRRIVEVENSLRKMSSVHPLQFSKNNTEKSKVGASPVSEMKFGISNWSIFHYFIHFECQSWKKFKSEQPRGTCHVFTSVRWRNHRQTQVILVYVDRWQWV